jgi:hypothetical protein
MVGVVPETAVTTTLKECAYPPKLASRPGVIAEVVAVDVIAAEATSLTRYPP